jgi:hypothetical protein
MGLEDTMDPTPQPNKRRATASELLDVLEMHSLEWWVMNGPDVIRTAELFSRAMAPLAGPKPAPREETDA